VSAFRWFHIQESNLSLLWKYILFIENVKSGEKYWIRSHHFTDEHWWNYYDAQDRTYAIPPMQIMGDDMRIKLTPHKDK